MNRGPTVNSSTLDGTPGISADGRTLFFTSYRPGQYGWLDIWVTRRETTNGPWSEPANLGPTINGWDGDFAPFISADGSTLLFGSDRPDGHGGKDLWQVLIAPTPISGSFRKNHDAGLAQEAVESENGKEVVPANRP